MRTKPISKDWLSTRVKELQRKIQAYLPLHGARLSFIAKFVIQSSWTNGGCNCGTWRDAEHSSQRAHPKRATRSRRKACQEIFNQVELEGRSFATLMLALLSVKDKLTVSLDRTTWELGSFCVNGLMLGVAYKGLAFPLLWVLLDKVASTCLTLGKLARCTSRVNGPRVTVFRSCSLPARYTFTTAFCCLTGMCRSFSSSGASTSAMKQFVSGREVRP